MKKLLFVLFAALSFASCEEGTGLSDDAPMAEATIVGRWIPEGFEDVLRYEFTEDTRYTIYGNGSGEFPTLEEFLQENPGIHGHPWAYEGVVVVMDLHFGNFSRSIPLFKCNNQVLDWMNEDGTFHSTLFREGHSMTECH